ncbi:MAG: NUDIX hydrolase [Thermoanaerobaculia bacterium]|nr:NUDIX hydrolase [Thermoanaerobaculia bacterium]
MGFPEPDLTYLGDLEGSLPPSTHLDVARGYLGAYRPTADRQADFRRRIMAFVDEHPEDAHRRTCREGHLTASGLVVDASLSRVLLLHHRKLDRWLQPGGHCDGDAELAGVALREATEESGMEGLRVAPRIIDLDVHEIPPYGDVPAHLHFDCRFVVVAPADAEPKVSDEHHALAYLPWDEALERAGDESVRRLIRVVRGIAIR